MDVEHFYMEPGDFFYQSVSLLAFVTVFFGNNFTSMGTTIGWIILMGWQSCQRL
jgi:hypothetical protein